MLCICSCLQYTICFKYNQIYIHLPSITQETIYKAYEVLPAVVKCASRSYVTALWALDKWHRFMAGCSVSHVTSIFQAKDNHSEEWVHLMTAAKNIVKMGPVTWIYLFI